MKKYLPYAFSTILFLSLIILGLQSGRDTVYIDIHKVMKEFQMRSDLENLLNLELKERKQGLDAVQAEMENLKDKDTLLMPRYKERYMKMLTSLQEFKADKAQEINGQLLNRINEAVREYGEENGYGYILGANGNGSIMYARADQDVSVGFIKFLNGRYEKN